MASSRCRIPCEASHIHCAGGPEANQGGGGGHEAQGTGGTCWAHAHFACALHWGTGECPRESERCSGDKTGAVLTAERMYSQIIVKQQEAARANGLPFKLVIRGTDFAPVVVSGRRPVGGWMAWKTAAARYKRLAAWTAGLLKPRLSRILQAWRSCTSPRCIDLAAGVVRHPGGASCSLPQPLRAVAAVRRQQAAHRRQVGVRPVPGRPQGRAPGGAERLIPTIPSQELETGGCRARSGGFWTKCHAKRSAWCHLQVWVPDSNSFDGPTTATSMSEKAGRSRMVSVYGRGCALTAAVQTCYMRRDGTPWYGKALKQAR